MSTRIKRQLSKAGGSSEGGGSAPSAAARKKRRIDNSGSDDEERSVWTPKHLGDLRAYNRSASEAPAELFRKDLISAMKLADNEPLSSEDYWGIGDPWKQEWERGVQVPVNPDSLPESTVTVTVQRQHRDREANFRLTKDKFIRVNHDDFFSNEQHILSNLPTKAEKMCRYDMDDLDDKWLNAYNGERARMGAAPVPSLIFEMIIEHLEETCWENIHKLLKTEESLSIEFDEDVICDVCRSKWSESSMAQPLISPLCTLDLNTPDSEEGNEMVFCDSCNICVHQACYGITAIPSGSWLCRTCSLGIKPDCVLCPNKGGAMKSTKSGQKWAHVACALWIPEVSIGSVERMEPITKIPNIPVSCIFFWWKKVSYCEKHSVSSKKLGGEEAESEEGEEGAPKKKKDWTSEQKNQARAAKLRQIESEFFKHVDVLETSNFLDIDFETTETIFNYWKLKRRSSFNKPLLTPRSEEIDLLSHQQEHDIERMKMFVQLRQYLERVRNLCYMVNRRERLSRSFIKIREQTFSKQVSLLSSNNMTLTPQEIEAVMQANHGHSVYDQLYSHHTAPKHTQKQFEKIVACIAGTLIEKVKSKKPPRKKDVNGLIRPKKEKSDNPYKKLYVNGAEQRRSRSSSLCSTSDTDSSLASPKWILSPKGNPHSSVYTSSEEEMNKENHSIKLESVSSKSKLSFLESSEKEKPVMESGCVSSRGRVGRRRRGNGRANAIKSKSFRERTAASSDDKDTKDFDALISEKNIKSETNASSSKTIREHPSVETSEDEIETVSKPKPQPGKRRNKKKAPPKVDVSVSSEDEPSVTVTPCKEKKSNRKGKWGKSAVGIESTSASSPVCEPPKLELSDDDELGPPTYKLSSDEDNSEKSNDPTAVIADVFGVSDRTDSSSDNGRNKALSKGPKKRDKKSETIFSESDVNSDDENKESTIDSQNHATLKTKAAKKEFTPKIEAKAERMNKKKSDKGGRTVKKIASVEKSKSEPKPADEADAELASTKGSEVEATPGHLFVPQRKAAKKASELITSQNTTSTSATPAVAVVAPTPAETTVAEAKKVGAKQVKEVKEEAEDPEIIEERKVAEEKKVTPTKGRKGKVTKDKNDRTVDEVKTEAGEAPKKTLFEPPEILPYVPMRQAAKKAAENLKVGNSKGTAVSTCAEEPEVVPAPVIPPAKTKRISRQESKLSVRSKSKSPRAAKHLSPANVTDSESESEPESSSTTKKVPKDQKDVQKPSKSIFSDSEEESVALIRKEKLMKEKPDPVPEAPKETSNAEPFFRGDVFVREYQSSSDENEGERPSTPGKKAHLSPTLKLGDECQESSKSQPFHGSSNISGDLRVTSDSDEREDENQEPAVGTLRKAPDKKLKTSEGRPEHGFQPPITERSESRVSIETEDDSAKPAVRRETGLEPRLRQSGAQCRPRTPSGDVPMQDIRSNSHAPLGGPRRGREREPPSLPHSLGASPSKPSGKREVQPEESLKSGKKVTEGGIEEKSTSTKVITASEKKETVKEIEAVWEKKELLREKKESLREEEVPKDKGSPSRETEVVHKNKDVIERENEVAPVLKPTTLREIDSSESNDIIIEKEVQRERGIHSREKILSPREKVLGSKERVLTREKVLPAREKVLPTREKVLSSREKILPSREKILPSREKSLPPKELLPPKEKVLPSREKVLPPRENVLLLRDTKDVSRDKVLHKDKETLPTERREIIREKELPKEKEVMRVLDISEDSLESQREQSHPLIQKLDTVIESEQTTEKDNIDKVEEIIPQKVEVVKESEPLRIESKNEEFSVREEEPVRTVAQAPAEPEVPVREKDSAIEQLNIPVAAEQQKKPGVFGYVDEEVKVERLADIVETSDTEPENKRVRIGDSDEDTVLVTVEKRVEQPKDSGYKSAITTPEPLDRVQPVCSEVVNVNSVNNFMPEESCLETIDANNKTPVVVPSPVEFKQSVNKFVSPARRKNLEDVIGEMKRQAEAQPEPSNSVPSSEGQNELSASPPHSQPNSSSFSVPPPESSVPSSQASSVETLTPKSSTSPAANFVEQWRGQWVKSPPPPDHKGDPSSGSHLPPHLPMPSLDLGLTPSMSMLELQRALYPDTQHQLFNPYDILNARSMLQSEAILSSRLRQMVEAGIPPQLFNPTLYLRQHSASEIAALSQQQYAQPSRENQIPDKPNVCSAQELARLPNLDNRPPTPEILPTNNKTNNLQAASGNKVGKPLTSPGLSCIMAAPPLPSPPTTGNKVVPGLTSPTTSRGQQLTAAREEPPSPVLPHNKSAQPQLSPSSIYNKSDTTVSLASQPQQTSVPLPEISPADHSVLMLRANRVPVESQVSPQSSKASQVAVSASVSSGDIVSGGNKCPRPLVSPNANSVLTTKKNVVPPVSNSVMTIAKSATTTTSLSLLNKSPLPVVMSPTSQRDPSPPHTIVEVPDSKIETITVDDSVIHQKEEPTQKRVPIYMQEPKPQKILEKKSRSRKLSPRWNKESPKTREKKSTKLNRASYNKGRGRNAGKGKGRGHSPRFNPISVPKELVGTVYDFDIDNEFDDDGPANNTLDDLRKSREKRQSVDTTPQQQSSTPTSIVEHKEQSPKKSSKKSKSSYKDKGAVKLNSDDDKVAKILEDYRNMQNSQLRRSVHSPTPPQGETIPDGPPKTPDRLENLPQFCAEYTANTETKITISNISEARESIQSSDLTVIQKAAGDHSKVSLTVPTSQIGIDERTNQLKLKIKGPYANSYSNSNTAAPPQEVVGAPTPTSTTSTLRRMRKKELIRQYCYQDQMPAEPPDSGPINSTPNPPPHVRTGITIPKAVASMTSIPTREDYKMYTQDDPPSTAAGGGRRKRPPRELRHLNVWAIREESGKRNSETTEVGDTSRKRPRGAKESKNLEEKDVSSAKPPPKLRISLGKKGSEVTTVTSDTKELAGKQRPPKKRLAEENPMVKIKSDNMKFREQIMADFDKPVKKGGLKSSDREKRAKKRKVYSGEIGHSTCAESKELDSSEKHDIKVITGDSTNAPKLVIRFGKGKSVNSSSVKSARSETNDSGSYKDERSEPDTVMPLSLKIRLSVPKPDSDSNKEESCVPKVPLKLKLSRRSDGYVASNTPRKPVPEVQDQGPGPPPPKPPDPFPEPQSEKNIPNTTPPSPPPPINPLIASGSQAESRLSQQENPKPLIPPSYDIYPHQGDTPTCNAPEQLNMGPLDYVLGGLGPPPRSDAPEEIFQRLEAQIAAASRSIPESGVQVDTLGSPRQQSGPPLPDVPSIHHTLYPYKEGSDCR
nr:PHD finger protein rhinoceros-like [Cherax quadricarinatus]